MSWALNRLGPQAIVYPGQQQHARTAIQCLSDTVTQERVFGHLGWTEHEQEWVYLHAGGGVGICGLRSDVQVELPDALQLCKIEPPADPAVIVSAVRSSLQLLCLAPNRITLPLLAAVHRAALGDVDFGIFLTGRTGTFKTALAALCQQHFGAGMDASQLPANFSSTANALEGLAFCAKDAVMVVDDFVPIGGHGDPVLQGVGERLFRGAGNHQGRSRLGANGRVRSSLRPRALILATGEEVPRGQSLRGRMLIVEIAPGEVNVSELSKCQKAAQEGQFAAAMGAYLMWIAPRYQELKSQLQKRVQALLLDFQDHRETHTRLPKIIAELQSGWELWLQFAREAGALGATDETDLRERGKKTLNEVALLQNPYQQASDPALCFLARIRGALSAGRAHVADRYGDVPNRPKAWGWQHNEASERWLPQGIRIGWVLGDDLFLESTAAYQVAQQSAGSERLSVSEQTLRYRLRDHGLLVSTDPGRQMLLVRRTLGGCARNVLHLRAKDIMLPDLYHRSAEGEEEEP